jgi:hypothetical protein
MSLSKEHKVDSFQKKVASFFTLLVTGSYLNYDFIIFDYVDP